MLNQTSAAIKTFNKAIEANPEFAGAYFMRGYLNILKKKDKKTLIDWNKAIQIDSTNAFYLFARSAYFLNIKSYPKAYKDMVLALKYHPIKKDRYKEFNTRTSMENMQALQTQVNIYEKYKYTLSDNACREVERCLGLFFEGDHREVDVLLNMLLNKKPIKSVLLFLRGYNAEFLKRNEVAPYYLSALQTKPLIDECYLRLGIHYQLKGDYQTAIDNISMYIEKNDSDCLAYRYIGISRMQLGLYNEAIEDFSKFLSLDSTEYDIRFNRANSYLTLGEYNKAIDDFTKVLKVRPNDKESYYGRALCYYNLKNKIDAVGDLNMAISINKYFVDALFLTGIIEMEEKNYVGAINSYTSVLKVEPKHVNALLNRGSVYFNMKQYEKALEDYNRIIAINSNIGAAYLSKGIVNLQLNNKTQACLDLKKAASLGEQRANALLEKYCK